MSTQKIVLITGANKGLGLATVRVAGIRAPSSRFILACRDTNAGEKAIEDLRQGGIVAPLELLQLDTTLDSEIEQAVQYIAKIYGKLDVLINNAGIAILTPNDTVSTLRAAYTEMLAVNVTSVACLCKAFQPLLAKSSAPKVINITSGLGSIANTLSKNMQRSAPYGTSKVALNGLTAHLQATENDRMLLAKDGDNAERAREIRYYSAAPGFLKTALTRFSEHAKDPIEGAEVVVQLLLNDEYPGGTQWEFQGGVMQQVPW